MAMTCRAVLVSADLPQSLLVDVERRLDDLGAPIESVRALSDGGDAPMAIDLQIAGQADSVRAAVRPMTDAADVDLAVLATVDGERPDMGVLVMDVDSTLVTGEVIDSLAAYAGRAEQVAAVTERAMRGELDFAESLHERVATLAGLPVSVLDEVRDSLTLNPGARTLIATLQQRGAVVGALSGGFIQILRPLAEELGLDHAAANELGVRDGVLTGTVVGPVVDRAEKLRCLRDIATQHDVAMEHTVAIGDGANDLDMISAAGLGIAYQAKPAVRAASPATISSGRLSDALLLMGIAPDQWTVLPDERP